MLAPLYSRQRRTVAFIGLSLTLLRQPSKTDMYLYFFYFAFCIFHVSDYVFAFHILYFHLSYYQIVSHTLAPIIKDWHVYVLFIFWCFLLWICILHLFALVFCILSQLSHCLSHSCANDQGLTCICTLYFLVFLIWTCVLHLFGQSVGRLVGLRSFKTYQLVSILDLALVK